MIYDLCTTFGELSEEAKQNQKYAKWKAAYIHNCLKNGETPHAGPLNSEEDELVNIGGNDDAPQPGTSSSFGWNTNPYDSQQPSNPPPEDPQPSGQFSSNDPFGNIRPPSPPKDPEEKNPGGFVPFDPTQSNIPYDTKPQETSAVSPEMIMKAQKYIKFAGSALTYEDIPTAIDNLQKSLRLLTTGQDS